MKILKINNTAHYESGELEHYTVELETSSRKILLKGCRSIEYRDTEGIRIARPAQVFKALQRFVTSGADCTINTDEPAMFNLETTITAQFDGGEHQMIFHHHVIHETNKTE